MKGGDTEMISSELLEILVCPACKGKVVPREDLLVCGACGRRYPVREGIPIMLVEEGDKYRITPPGGAATE